MIQEIYLEESRVHVYKAELNKDTMVSLVSRLLLTPPFYARSSSENGDHKLPIRWFQFYFITKKKITLIYFALQPISDMKLYLAGSSFDRFHWGRDLLCFHRVGGRLSTFSAESERNHQTRAELKYEGSLKSLRFKGVHFDRFRSGWIFISLLPGRVINNPLSGAPQGCVIFPPLFRTCSGESRKPENEFFFNVLLNHC